MNMMDGLEPLLRSAPLRSFSAGSTVLYQGEAPRSAFIVKSGIVKAFNISARGEEQIISLYEEAEIFPIAWVFKKSPVAIYFYEALIDCEIYTVSRDELKKFITKHSGVMQIILEHYVTSYTASLVHISALEQAKAREKIMYTLYFLCRRYGHVQKDDLAYINLQLTHQDIANLVGLTRETTATELNRLKQAGIVKYSKRQYIINMTKLLEGIGEDSFVHTRLQ